jgi:YhcH/YjgK/YiaL family protein
MIYDTFDRIERYFPISGELRKGLEYLRNTDFSKLPDGRYEIDGERVYASVSTYETKAANETPEAHRRYADIQFLIEGRELVGVAPLSEMREEVEARSADDIWFYHGETERLTLTGRRFLVLFPEDAHAPCIADGTVSTVHKCVVKVQI